VKQKSFKFDPETLSALRLLERESGKGTDALLQEALELLFAKHGVPRNLDEALRFSLRKFPLNDNAFASAEADAR
jgi:hypothetical protein